MSAIAGAWYFWVAGEPKWVSAATRKVTSNGRMGGYPLFRARLVGRSGSVPSGAGLQPTRRIAHIPGSKTRAADGCLPKRGNIEPKPTTLAAARRPSASSCEAWLSWNSRVNGVTLLCDD